MAKVNVLVRITGRNFRGGVYDHEKEVVIDLPKDFVLPKKEGDFPLVSQTMATKEIKETKEKATR